MTQKQIWWQKSQDHLNKYRKGFWKSWTSLHDLKKKIPLYLPWTETSGYCGEISHKKVSSHQRQHLESAGLTKLPLVLSACCEVVACEVVQVWRWCSPPLPPAAIKRVGSLGHESKRSCTLPGQHSGTGPGGGGTGNPVPRVTKHERPDPALWLWWH